jgi:hypothetical protein
MMIKKTFLIFSIINKNEELNKNAIYGNPE